MDGQALLYVTCADREEGARIAGTLLQEGLIACANIAAPHTAVYRWEGEVRQEPETAMIVKTRRSLVDRVSERIEALHSYDCPCVVALPVEGGLPAFRTWIESETAAAAGPGPDCMIEGLDHLVLTAVDPEATCAFYSRVLGMEVRSYGQSALALHFGRQKINVHRAGAELSPAARHPTPGGGDFCLLSRRPVAELAEEIRRQGVEIEVGPVERTGAQGRLLSIYFRDPDGTLVEVANLIAG